MLQVLTKFICFLIMYTAGCFVIRNFTDNYPKIKMNTNLCIALLAIVTIFLSKEEYATTYTIVIFLLNIVVYKNRFKLDISQATIAVSILMLLIIISDIAITPVLRLFFTQNQIKNDFVVAIIANMTIALSSIGIINIPTIKNKLKLFYNNINSKKKLGSLAFLIILIVGICNLVYRFASNPIDKTYIHNFVILISFLVIAYIFIENQNNYKMLSSKYDSLFNYVQNFEDWIEKEQLNRHEYKNKLAVIRTITKDKKVINKIDEILEDSINIEDEIVSQLKDLPKGGLKGLLYYKVAIAQKKRIKLIVDVSIKNKSYLQKLNENQIRDICILIGIYFDNAIEAAENTKEKYVLLEIYELSDKINIVISNTFKEEDNLDNRNEKGITSKGEGHGYGLYFANKIVTKNKWIESNQEVVEKYYIQTLSIKKLDK